MQLLGRQEVKEAKNVATSERTLRVDALITEESNLIKTVNHLRDKHGTEKLKLNAELATHTKGIDKKRAKLTGEVHMLEKRRAEAMEPIEAEREKVKKILKKADKTTAELNDRKSDLIAQESDMNQLNEERKQELDDEDTMLKSAKRQFKISTKNLSTRWLEFYRNVREKNDTFAVRERDVTDREQNCERREIRMGSRMAQRETKVKQILAEARKTLQGITRHKKINYHGGTFRAHTNFP